MAVCTTTCDDDVVPRTVLVVDDHPSFRATARALLEAEGVSVVGEAADGAEAIVTTSDHEPHKVATIALALTAGVSFVVSGLIALRRRPENRVGLYLAAVGYLWFLGALGDANNNTVWTVGMFLSNLALIPF